MGSDLAPAEPKLPVNYASGRFRCYPFEKLPATPRAAPSMPATREIRRDTSYAELKNSLHARLVAILADKCLDGLPPVTWAIMLGNESDGNGVLALE